MSDFTVVNGESISIEIPVSRVALETKARSIEVRVSGANALIEYLEASLYGNPRDTESIEGKRAMMSLLYGVFFAASDSMEDRRLILGFGKEFKGSFSRVGNTIVVTMTPRSERTLDSREDILGRVLQSKD